MKCRWMIERTRSHGAILALSTFMMCVFSVPNSTFAQDNIFADDPAGGQPDAGQPGPDDFPDIFQPAVTRTPEELAALQAQVDQLNAEAAALAQSEDLDAALAKYDEALAVESNFVSLFEKGKLLADQEYSNEAIQVFLQASTFAATLEPEQILEIYMEIGSAYLDTERYNDAITYYSGALALPGQGRNPEVLYNLGYAQSEFALNQQFSTAQTRQEDLLKALDSYDRALAIKPDYSDALYERGNTYLLLQDLDGAVEDLSQAAELDPSNPEIVAQLGIATLSRGLSVGATRNGQLAQIKDDLNTAVRQFTSWLSLVPESEVEEEDDDTEFRREEILLRRSLAYLNLGDESEDPSQFYRMAITDAEASIEMDPLVAEAHYQKALAHRMLGEMDAALDAYTETIEVSPANAEALLRRGILYFREGDYELAKADLSLSIRFTGGANPRAFFWRGVCHARQDQPAKAIDDYTSALKYQPLLTMASFNRGLAYMKLGRFAQAKDDFTQVLRRERNNQQARTLRDTALQHMQ